MATVDEIKALMTEQKNDFVKSVKEEFASMKTELAKELCTELREFVQQEIAKHAGESDAKRKAPRTSDDMDAEEQSPKPSSSSGARRVAFRPSPARPAVGRPPRAGSAPPTRTTSDSEEHLILIKLPEPVHEVIPRPWWDGVVSKLPIDAHPVEVTIRPFHDYISLGFLDAERCTSCAVALRNFGYTLTTRSGDVKPVIIIRSRPPPVQRRGRGLHPFYAALKDGVIAASEEIKQIHRWKGLNPHTLSHAVNPATGAARLLLTVRWIDSDPDAPAVRIIEVLPDDSLPPDIREQLRKIADA